MKNKYRKLFSFLVTFILFILIIALVLIIVIPNLINAGIELKEKFPDYVNRVKEYIEDSRIRYSVLNDWIQDLDIDVIKDKSINFVKGGMFDWLGSSFTIASSVFGSLLSLFLGIIFSIYFLFQKEELAHGARRLLRAVFPESVSEKTLYISGLTKKAFSDFLLAQSLEALILGIIFFIALLIFKFPYTVMISIVIAVFSFIPIVGAFAGLIIGAILIFVESPKSAGLFIIMFLVLQQIEGNLIYPRIVGKLSGLSPLYTLAAVTIGGSLMGIGGIILFVPLFSVLQILLKEFVENRTKERINQRPG